MKIVRDVIILLMIFGLIWLANYYFFKRHTEDNFRAMSSSQKEKLAHYLDKQIKIEYDVYSNEKVETTIDKIFYRLSPDKEYEVTLLESSEMNAFATLDGRIYLLTGLIGKCETPEMLAAVIAHEMGHLENEHLISRLKNEIGLSVLFSIITGGDPTLIAELSQTALGVHFSRDQEREADEFSHQLMIKKDLHPSNFNQFMEIVMEETDHPSFLAFFGTHPLPEERIENTLAVDLPEDFEEQPIDVDWDQVQELLN